MVQLSTRGTANSCRSWCGPLLARAEDLRGRRNGRTNIQPDKGLYLKLCHRNCREGVLLSKFYLGLNCYSTLLIGWQMMYYNIFITVYFIEQMPLALKNRVKNVAGNKNAEKSCTKGSVQKYD